MFDLAALSGAVAAQGCVARIVVAATEGSAPREVGAAMLVWDGGSAGTIGGGALEWAAMERARARLRSGAVPALDRLPLGPALGQCCGGAATLLTEVYTAETLPVPEAGLIARPVDQGAGMPLAVKRLLARARGEGHLPGPALVQGWMVEPVAARKRALWVWGAGHVGRALLGVLAPLPDLAITWVDVAPDRFPATIPAEATCLPAANPALLVPHCPPDADHLVLTFSHALDLDLCHRLLAHGFASLGLIGSQTKWARFRSRLRALGHTEPQIARIRCPIGDPALGKHPQAIAIGVVQEMLHRQTTGASRQENAG
jgi:xanthine dehydrogenase accessory factor